VRICDKNRSTDVLLREIALELYFWAPYLKEKRQRKEEMVF